MSLSSQPFRQRVILRWADIDANFHLRHSVYYDLGAAQRMDLLAAMGVNMRDMQKGGFAPVLFREECRFLREIRLEDAIDVETGVAQMSRDFRKFAFQQRFLRGEEVCAILRVEGAWFDARTRKIAAPPQPVIDVFLPLAENPGFTWLE